MVNEYVAEQSKIREDNDVQPLKALLPILVTEAGMVTSPLLLTAEQSHDMLTTRHDAAGIALPLTA